MRPDMVLPACRFWEWHWSTIARQATCQPATGHALQRESLETRARPTNWRIGQSSSAVAKRHGGIFCAWQIAMTKGAQRNHNPGLAVQLVSQ